LGQTIKAADVKIKEMEIKRIRRIPNV